jgi:hypothetical protein
MTNFLSMLFAEVTPSLGVSIQDDYTLVKQKIVEYIPKLIGFLLILVIGWFIAWALARVARMIAENLGLQSAAERSGLAQSMRDVGIERTLPQILSQVVYWVVVILTLMLSIEKLDITGFHDSVIAILNFFPKFIVAMITLVIGLLLAKFLRGVVATSVDRMGLNYAETLANIIYLAVVVVLLHEVCGQLGLKLELLQHILLIGFSGAMLGIGLAVGLGGRDVVNGILAGYYVRQNMKSGDRVTVGEIVGTVREVGPVSTILDVQVAGVTTQKIVPNSKMLHEAVR